MLPCNISMMWKSEQLYLSHEYTNNELLFSQRSLVRYNQFHTKSNQSNRMVHLSADRLILTD